MIFATTPLSSMVGLSATGKLLYDLALNSSFHITGFHSYDFFAFHWLLPDDRTMPFVGERYSFVWFTPKGCEGMRGVDLRST
jgi:hypothetical protein